MIIGSYILALATMAAVLSAAGYYLVARGSVSYLTASRWSYYLMTGLVLFATVYLVSLFLNDSFEYAYISGYSSTDLPANYKITSLWAGQEGSFLLWAAFGVLLGLWVKSKAREQLGWVMFFYLVGQLFLFSLLNISSPFRMNDFVPVDGRGLNPLLQNFWMQIHPPIVFLGYASTFVPYAFAMAALATKKFDNWVTITLPWAIFSVCTMGTGIFLGGYWAYETLGWGGYWGWDPVENASLVPWLGSIALVHGMILERARKAFRKTNLFLAITTFLMVIYGTFLTRSGVLADFSVHSFVDLGLNAYLAILLIGFAVVSYGFWLVRTRGLVSAEPSKTPVSKEFAIYLGMLFLILSAFLVLLGMSSPLLTRIFGEPSAVDLSYYALTNLPIAIIIGIILGLAPALSWASSSWTELRKNLILPVGISILMIIIGLIFGVTDIIHLLFIFTSGFAFASNLIMIVNRFKNGVKNIQADIIHAGVGLMLIGIIISSGYSRSEKATLEKGKTSEIAGFDFTFTGSEWVADNKEKANILVEKGSTVFKSSPVFLWSNQGLVRNPYIKKFLFYDLYISPEEIKTIKADTSSYTTILKRGQSALYEDFEITFKDFDVGSHMEGDLLAIGAELEVKAGDGRTEIIKPVYMLAKDNPELIPAKLPEVDKYVYLLKISADEAMIMLGISDKKTPDEFKDSRLLIIEVSKKPFINFVWLGLILIIIGSGLATHRRLKEVK
jgi:cytochrome c-type biogenesis protein CcmF